MRRSIQPQNDGAESRLARLRLPGVAALCAWMTACGGPAHMQSYVAPDATARATAPRVAILPPDFTLQIAAAASVSEEERTQMQREIETQANQMLVDLLKQRGFDPMGVDLANAQQTVRALAQGFVYHANTVAGGAAEGGGAFDPAVLASAAPGADLVLYLNGSAVTVSDGRRAEQIAVIVTCSVIVAAVVVLMIYAGAKAGPGIGDVGPRVTVPIHAPGALVPRAPGIAFRPVLLVPQYPEVWWGPVPVDVDSPRPPPPPPRADRGFFSGADLRVFATLVDVASGKVLWHVDKATAASADDPSELRDALISAFSTLPMRLAASP